MGYYTTYDITIKGEDNTEDIKKRLEEISLYGFEMYPKNLISEDEFKWYDWETHMTSISKEFPNNLFQVDGQGEESHDTWRCFFHNGRIESVKVETVYSESSIEANFDVDVVIAETLTSGG